MPKKIINDKSFSSLAFINFIFAVFFDSVFIYNGFKIKHLESVVYLVCFNLMFVVFTILAIKKRKKAERPRLDFKAFVGEYYPITLVVIFSAVLAILNFDTVAVYDAHLYYGSFITGIDLFEMTARTAIGALNLWNHSFIGTSLFLVPFECMNIGNMTGTYTATLLLFSATLFVLYAYLRDMFKGSSKWFITFCVAVFAFMPYSHCLITYFCPDFYLELYLIWLLYAYKKDNQLMVAFSGFLLCFTKEAGAMIYGAVVLFLFISEVLSRYGFKDFSWLKPKNLPFGRFILWLTPAIMCIGTFKLQNILQLQVFEASGTLSFGFTKYNIIIQSLITFVYGFRWIVLVLFAAAILVKLVHRESDGKSTLFKFTKEYKLAVISLALGILALNAIFSVLSLSHCPRYTTPMNVLYVILFAYSIAVIFSNSEAKKTVAAFVMTVLLGIQMYVTIDPIVKSVSSGIVVGEDKIYNVASVKNRDAGFFEDCIGDYFVYNNEYTAQPQLADTVLRSLQPQNDVTILVYDTYYYEYHIGGLQYRIFWDKEKLKQTYRTNDNTIFVGSATLNPEDISSELGEYVYVMIPARNNYDKAISQFAECGYEIDYATGVDSFYGYSNIVIFHLVQ